MGNKDGEVKKPGMTRREKIKAQGINCYMEKAE